MKTPWEVLRRSAGHSAFRGLGAYARPSGSATSCEVPLPSVTHVSLPTSCIPAGCSHAPQELHEQISED